MGKILSVEEQRQYLLSRKNENNPSNIVRFSYPEKEMEGRIIDTHAVLDSNENDDPIYWNIIDLIEFTGESERWLRIGYWKYVKDNRRFKNKNQHWVFAGQTALADPISSFIKLFSETIKEKDWFRKFIKDIY